MKRKDILIAIVGPITMTMFAPCNNHKRCITLHDWVVEQILKELQEDSR